MAIIVIITTTTIIIIIIMSSQFITSYDLVLFACTWCVCVDFKSETPRRSNCWICCAFSCPIVVSPYGTINLENSSAPEWGFAVDKLQVFCSAYPSSKTFSLLKIMKYSNCATVNSWIHSAFGFYFLTQTTLHCSHYFQTCHLNWGQIFAYIILYTNMILHHVFKQKPNF